MHAFEGDRYYRTSDPELALIATRSTLGQWRHRGEGPPYLRFGNRVLYRGSDLNRWLAAHPFLARRDWEAPHEATTTIRTRHFRGGLGRGTQEG